MVVNKASRVSVIILFLSIFFFACGNHGQTGKAQEPAPTTGGGGGSGGGGGDDKATLFLTLKTPNDKFVGFALSGKLGVALKSNPLEYKMDTYAKLISEATKAKADIIIVVTDDQKNELAKVNKQIDSFDYGAVIKDIEIANLPKNTKLFVSATVTTEKQNSWKAKGFIDGIKDSRSNGSLDLFPATNFSISHMVLTKDGIQIPINEEFMAKISTFDGTSFVTEDMQIAKFPFPGYGEFSLVISIKGTLGTINKVSALKLSLELKVAGLDLIKVTGDLKGNIAPEPEPAPEPKPSKTVDFDKEYKLDGKLIVNITDKPMEMDMTAKIAIKPPNSPQSELGEFTLSHIYVIVDGTATGDDKGYGTFIKSFDGKDFSTERIDNVEFTMPPKYGGQKMSINMDVKGSLATLDEASIRVDFIFPQGSGFEGFNGKIYAELSGKASF